MKTEIEGPVPQNTVAEAELFHARLRPSYPKLIVVDDGESSEGEVVRLRTERLTIGRHGCDLNFPAERMMSSSHCTIALESSGPDQWHWVIRDAGSRHGLFMRLREFNVTTRNEWIAGGTRFVIGGPSSPALAISEINYSRFVNKEIDDSELLIVSGYNYTFKASLGIHKRMEIGSTLESNPYAIPDVQLEPNHFTMRYLDQNCWNVSDCNTLNGTWLRVNYYVVSSSCSFIVGEQRFTIVFDTLEGSDHGR